MYLLFFRAVDLPPPLPPPPPPPRAISVLVPLGPPPLLVGGTAATATSPYQVPPPTRWRGGSCTPPRAAVVDVAPPRTHAVTASVRCRHRILCLCRLRCRRRDAIPYLCAYNAPEPYPARPPSSSLLNPRAKLFTAPALVYIQYTYHIL